MEEAPVAPVVTKGCDQICCLCHEKLILTLSFNWVTYFWPEKPEEKFLAHTWCYVDKFVPKEGWFAPAGKKEDV